VKSYGFVRFACPNGDRCRECLHGAHTRRVEEPTAETVDEAVDLIRERMQTITGRVKRGETDE
jgi:hypothetical protein